MKTFRTIGLTLAAVLMCVNFTACEEDDDEPAQNNKSKKLVEIKSVCNGKSSYEGNYTATMTLKFSYDENNRLVSCEHNEEYYNEDDEENSISVQNYTWEGNSISQDYRDYHELYKLENGLIKSMSESIDVNGATEHIAITELTYNSDNRIIELNRNNEIARYTWENNKITSYDEEEFVPYSISYNDKTCNGHFPLFWITPYLPDLVLTNPELFGLKLNALPSKIEINTDVEDYKGSWEFDSYTFDSDGYVKSFTVNFYESDSEENCTVTLKWE